MESDVPQTTDRWKEWLWFGLSISIGPGVVALLFLIFGNLK